MDQEDTNVPVQIVHKEVSNRPNDAAEESTNPPTETKYCANCGTQIDKKAEICPNCGVNPSKKPEGKPSKYCINCGSNIDINAEICTKCGIKQSRSMGKNPAIAAILSFFIIGLGQIYAGKPMRGIVLLIGITLILMILHMLTFIFIGFLAYMIGPIIWVINIYDAYRLAQGESGSFAFIDEYTHEA